MLTAVAILYLSIDEHHTIKPQILFPGSNRLCVDCFAEIEESNLGCIAGQLLSTFEIRWISQN